MRGLQMGAEVIEFGGGVAGAGQGMIGKSVKRFSLATNAEGVCAEIMPKTVNTLSPCDRVAD